MMGKLFKLEQIFWLFIFLNYQCFHLINKKQHIMSKLILFKVDFIYTILGLIIFSNKLISTV